VYPTIIIETLNTKSKYRDTKQRAQSGLTTSVGDNRLGGVNQHEDPAESWAMLKMMFLEGDQHHHIQRLTNKFYGMAMKEGGETSTHT
jgi:hypothetical protein